MKRLELPHQLADYLCPVNGLCDVYEWKTGKRIPEELIFYSKAGFQMISQKKAAVPKMIFMGQGSIGKREYEFWKGIVGYEVIADEGKCFRTTWKNVRQLLDQDIPVILFGLDMFYLPYQSKFYHRQHIPGHVVLMIGYDETNVYVHDNSKAEMQTIPIAELELAWAEDYIGISKKNAYFGIDMRSPETDTAWIVQKGIGKNAETYLSSPLSFVGQRGLDRFIGEFPEWKNIFPDQACGTGGMLSTSYNFIKRYNPTADVRLFGQEINPESYAICLAEMLIKGQNAENICYQDTMKKDRFPETKMRFVIENPPFGTPWGGKDAAEGVEDAVNEEYKKGFDGRWGAGLPGSGDMQMLFLQSAIDKMDDNLGRAAIIEHGGPLYTGSTASGESQIRRWMLENDLIEAIIALSTDLFYNTPLTTYIWVLSKNKRLERKGKVQLIDASSFFHKLRKGLGDKKNEISPEDRKTITNLYASFEENEFSKVFNNEEFMYREYAIMQPLQRSYSITSESIESMIQNGALNNLYDATKVEVLENTEELTGKELKKLETYQKNKPVFDAIFNALTEAVSDTVYYSPDDFMPVLMEILKPITTDKKIVEKIADGLSVMDKNAKIQRDRKGNVIYDKASKDTVFVNIQEDIEDYMAREVWPYVPDAKAFFEEKLGVKKPVIKTGAEISFTKYFYKYQQPESSEVLAEKFIQLDKQVTRLVSELFSTEV